MVGWIKSQMGHTRPQGHSLPMSALEHLWYIFAFGCNSHLQSQCFHLHLHLAPWGSPPALLSSTSLLAASSPPPSSHPGWSFHHHPGQTTKSKILIFFFQIHLINHLCSSEANHQTCKNADCSSFSPSISAVSPIILGPISSMKSSKSINPPTVMGKIGKNHSMTNKKKNEISISLISAPNVALKDPLLAHFSSWFVALSPAAPSL